MYVGAVQEPARFPGSGAELTGRRAECGVLDRLVETVRSGESRVLVVYGEPGAGKTALLEYLAGRASGCRVTRVVGVQAEMELAFAGLHQMCTPLLDHLAVLPAPQREELVVAAHERVLTVVDGVSRAALHEGSRAAAKGRRRLEHGHRAASLCKRTGSRQSCHPTAYHHDAHACLRRSSHALAAMASRRRLESRSGSPIHG